MYPEFVQEEFGYTAWNSMARKNWFLTGYSAIHKGDTKHWWIQGSSGTLTPPLGPISFIFMQFSAKLFSNNRLAAQTYGSAPPSGKSWIRLYEMCLFEIVLICRATTATKNQEVKLSIYSFFLGSGSGGSSDPFMMWIPPVNSYSIGDTYLSVFNDAEGGDFRNYYSIVIYSPDHQTDIMVVCKTKSHWLTLRVNV